MGLTSSRPVTSSGTVPTGNRRAQPLFLAVRPHAAGSKTSATSSSGRGAQSFRKGLEALDQYIRREEATTVTRAHVRRLPDGTEHRTGICISNQRARRARKTAGASQ
ncbi:hypothetical protein ACIA98_36245 [Streptomyces sp. NPDC051366]|uniref:hypothetical protein n=1 Tax=Streptomyces sp. NPDC051366 TaxID=3365652 RepID=UPI0037931DB0